MSHCGGEAATPETEFEYTMEKIGENFSNYSAWHNRTNLLPVVRPSPGAVHNVAPEAIEEELETVVQAFYIDPSDQSAWIYHRWLLGREENPPTPACVQVQVVDGLLLATVVLTHPGYIVPDAVKVSWDGAVVAGNWSPVQPVPRSALAVTATAAVTTPCAAWKFKSAAAVAMHAAPPPADGAGAGSESSIPFTAEFGEGALNSVSRVPVPEACSVTVAVPAGGAAGGAVANVGDASGLRRAVARYIIPSEELLAGQLESCRELLEELDEGGERKWALLAIVYILNGLGGAPEQRGEMYAAVDALKAIDSSRRRYYDDLKSRYVKTLCATSLWCLFVAPLCGASLWRLSVAPLCDTSVVISVLTIDNAVREAKLLCLVAET